VGCGVCNGLSWLRIEIVVGTFECGNQPSGFHKVRGISFMSTNLLASQEGLCVSKYVSKG
jgi:hypothetical protein